MRLSIELSVCLRSYNAPIHTRHNPASPEMRLQRTESCGSSGTSLETLCPQLDGIRKTLPGCRVSLRHGESAQQTAPREKQVTLRLISRTGRRVHLKRQRSARTHARDSRRVTLASVGERILMNKSTGRPRTASLEGP